MVLRKKLKVRPMAIKALLLSLVAILVVNVLARFGVISLEIPLSPLVAGIIIPLFIFLDVGVLQKGRGKLDNVDRISVVVATILFIGGLAVYLPLEVITATNTFNFLLGIAESILALVLIVNIYKN